MKGFRFFWCAQSQSRDLSYVSICRYHVCNIPTVFPKTSGSCPSFNQVHFSDSMDFNGRDRKNAKIPEVPKLSSRFSVLGMYFTSVLVSHHGENAFEERSHD